MAWTGFTDEQLMQLKNQGDTPADQANHPRNSHPRRPPQHARLGAQRKTQANRNTAPRGRGPPRPVENPSQDVDTLNPNQMLSKPREVPNRPRSQQQRPRPAPSSNEDPAQRRVNSKGRQVRNEQVKIPETGGKGKEKLRQDGKSTDEKQLQEKEDEVENQEVLTEELDEKEGLSRELSKLEKFQEEQKKMETENARRKALLGKAIADRKKKTQAEAKRLAYIQKELAKIEDLLTNDVRILRDRIEEVSRTYTEAQKRYQKAEEEFVAAKMHLHKMEDMKESLTEHLCTIIHKNEVRKAGKLEELVNKLEVDNLDEFETQLVEESKAPQSPTTKTTDKPTDNAAGDASKTALNNGTSVVIATNQTDSEKSPDADTSGTSTRDPQDSSKTLESQPPEGSVNHEIVEGAVSVQSNQGAKQESVPITATSQVSEEGGNQDWNPSADQKVAVNETGEVVKETSSAS